MKNFSDYGIFIPSGTSGHIRLTCPQCSPNRKKKYERCLSVDIDEGVWYCQHCGWHGGLGGTKKDAEKAERVFQKPHFVQSEITDKRVLDWFAGRGISAATLAAFHVKSGLAWMYGKNGGGETNTIQFPFYLGGEVVNVKYRTGDKRFRQEKNARKCLYNFDMAMTSTSDRLLICEGEMDCLALYEAGFRGVVSVPDGAPPADAKSYSTKFEFLEGAEQLFDKFKWIVLAVDNDAPGKKLEDELSRRLGKQRCLRVAWPDGCKDANDVLVKHGKETLYSCIQNAEMYPIDGVKGVIDLWGAMFDLRHKPPQPGAEIGWENGRGVFNVETGQMTIVTGIPSHGKSTYIDALRVNLFRDYGWPSAVFSPENWPAENHLQNLVSMYCHRDYYELTDDELYNELYAVMGAFFFIQPERDDDMMDVDTILSRAKELVYRNGIKVLVIDPWNEIEHNIPAGQREDQYISIQLAKIRRFARVHDVHVFVIAHPRQLEKNKDGEYPLPTAYDIAGGAMWRNKADNILCVFRPDLQSGAVEVHVQKIRFRRNGKAGAMMRYVYHVGTSTYVDKGGVQ